MTVTIKNVGNGAGWGKYVLFNRAADATIIKGDIELGDEISKSIDHYKSGNSVNFVISFAKEDNVSQDKGREIAKEFMKSFMYGFREDEYHLDIVEHTDTDYLHYHARVPKINLLTNTQLKLYYHKSDLNYKKAVINEIAERYELVTGEEMKETINNPLEQFNQIDKWREEHGQEPLDLSSPKQRREAEKQVNEYISSLIQSGLIDSFDDVKAEIGAIGLEINNEGYDKGKEFHYLTINNSSGKIRIKGDIYGQEFYRYSKEDRREKISSNRSTRGRELNTQPSRADIEQALSKERIKRDKFINKQYGGARKRAFNRNTKETPLTNKRDGKEVSRTSKQSVYQDIQENDGRHRHTYLLTPLHGDRSIHRNKDSRPITSTDRLNQSEVNPSKRDDLLRRKRFSKIFQIFKIRNKYKKRRIDNDRARDEINQSVKNARADIQRGIEEHYQELSSKLIRDSGEVRKRYLTAGGYNREATQNIRAIHGSINQLADKYRQDTDRKVGEFTGIIDRECNEIQKGSIKFTDIVGGRIQTAIGKLTEYYSKVVDKIKELLIERTPIKTSTPTKIPISPPKRRAMKR